jgi:hypothetical protein
VIITSSVQWPDDKTGPWRITLNWATVGGRMECIGVGFSCSADLHPDRARPILASEIRAIPIAGIIQNDRPRIHAWMATVAGMVAGTAE